MTFLDEPAVVDAAVPSRTFDVQLPRAAMQGDPLWYGLRMRYRLDHTGLPEGASVYLLALWNGEGVIQEKFQREAHDLAALDATWSSVTLIDGHRVGSAAAGHFDIEAGNYAPIPAVQGGLTQIEFRLVAPVGVQARVEIDRSSVIFGTRVGPTDVEVSGKAHVTSKSADVDLTVKNLGRATERLSAEVWLWFPDGSVHKAKMPDTGPIEHGAVLRQAYSMPLDDYDGAPAIVAVRYEWDGGGTGALQVHPSDVSGSSFPDAVLTELAIGCFVALWVTIPELWSRVARFHSRRGTEVA